MIRSLTPLTLLLLAACATGPSNPTVMSVKVPQVTSTQFAYDLRFDPQGRLDAPQSRALGEYLESIGIGYGDRIALDDGVPAGRATRRASVAQVASRFGLMIAEDAPVTAGAVPPGVTRIVITRSTAEVPNCPDWSRTANYDGQFSTMSNFGCSVNGNFAAMIADPNDLVAGKPYEGVDGHTTQKAVKNFRDRAPTGTAKVASPGAAK